MEKLQWKKLLCENRIRQSHTKTESEMKGMKLVTRNEFEADYDRIVGSSSVRRLQDKAQVFPLQKNDVVRTRLTHSIEVSALARSLAKTVGMELERRKEFVREDTEKLMGLLQTAGLIHDLGNPPFGHYGEDVIKEWYGEKILQGKSENDIDQKEQDFLHFDGNVQNLRIVTKLQTMNDEYGVNFTFGTLATIIKYPYSSVNQNNKKEKFGYFKSEEEIVHRIWENTGLEEGVRHPATYLLEAADDIAYICDDIEDGVKKGYILWEKEYENIKRKFGNEERYKKLFGNIEKNKPHDEMGKVEQMVAKARLFRNYTQGFLMQTAVETFFDEYDSIMDGEYGLSDLLEKDKKFVKCLKNITAEYCYSCDEVLTLEVVGKRVIKELLDIFYEAVVKGDSKKINDKRCYEGKIYHLISDNYKFIAKFDYENGIFRDFEDITEYDKMHLIVDFISGMTDSYAVSLYKKLLGISLPE